MNGPRVPGDGPKPGSDNDRSAIDGEDGILDPTAGEDDSLLPGGALRGALFEGLADEVQGTAPGSRLGSYRLIERMGRGGMGEVWRAEQVEPVRRDVAIKLIRLGMDSAEVLARFRAERQALARMDHTNIARVYDAGATEAGRPYFVMELVRGLPITEFCDQRRLTTRERLELFRDVCAAVQHAHQKGIIHRDLKPSNILVALEGDEPVAKVIDFGIAKAVGEPLGEGAARTRIGQWVGTPEYMSPEQADQSVLDVDTRSDVYSLGAVLYELLAGAPLYEVDQLRGAGPDEIRRRIREVEPALPSRRLSTSRQTAGEVAARRRTAVSSLTRSLRGDLDWIVMKSLEKERERRYQSAHELAQDLGRHLRHEPVLAGPPSPAYRLSKFVRRHRLAVAAGVLVALAILGGAALAAVGLVRARRAEEVAVAEAAKANAINGFLRRLLGSARPQGGLGREVTVVEALAAARRDLDGSFDSEPEIAADIRSVMGTTYHELGLHDEARELLEDALGERRRLRGDVDAAVASTLNELARLEHTVGNLDRAERYFVEVLAINRELFGDEHSRVAATLNNLGMLHVNQGKLEQAEALLTEALELKRRLYGPVHPEVTPTLNNLGMLLGQLGEHERAQRYLEEALEGNRQLHGSEHGLVAINLNNLATSYADQGKLELAEQTYREALELKRTAFGEEHTSFGITLSNLAEVIDRRGEHESALPLHDRALAIYRATLEPGNYRTAQGQVRRGLCLLRLDRLDEAEAELREGLAALRASVGEDDARTRQAVDHLAELEAVRARSRG
ncbi:MAG TPA: serine/threonine-protein kinase [Thermoanaerobaculia bacterium]|nr:serine/threonine-protein kinase [Thermoanaerobaculia bacterium]